jgi:hypothetical protein
LLQDGGKVLQLLFCRAGHIVNREMLAIEDGAVTPGTVTDQQDEQGTSNQGKSGQQISLGHRDLLSFGLALLPIHPFS